MASYVSKIRAEFDARQATEAMYALSERARSLNKLLAEQRKRWEETDDPKVKEAIDSNIKRLESEVAAVEKLNNTIEKSISKESAFQQVLSKGTEGMSQARLTSAQRNAAAIMRNINPQDEMAYDQMNEAQRVMNAAGKQIASLKNGFMDAMRTVEEGVEGKALPELKRLEAALTEAQKFSTDDTEWNKYQEAISKVRLEMQAAAVASIEMEEKNGKVAASLKYGFEDAFKSFEDGIDGMALPQLKRLEASLTETQKFSVDAEEWQKYGTAIDTVRQKIQGITGEYLSIGDAMKYGEQIEKQTFTGTIADLERAKKLLTDYRKTIKQTADGGVELKKIDDNLEIIDEQIKGVYLSTEKFNEILSNPKGKSFDELKAAVEKAEKQLYSMRRETDEERQAFLNLKEQIDGAKEEMNGFKDVQDDTTSGMDDLVQSAKRLAAAYLGLQGFSNVWSANVDMSDAMADVRKTTGMTAEQVENLTQRVKEIDTRTANEQLLSLSATAGQLGLSAEEDVLGFTKAANQITVALNELGNDGVLSLMKVSQVTGALEREGGNVEKTLLRVGSAINELSAASSATAGPITDFISRVGGVASTAKLSMADIAALGATTDALAISAELAGTQMNIFLSGMQKHTDAVANLLGVSQNQVQTMIDEGKAMDLMVQTLEKMETLNAVELSDFLKEMGSSGSRATQVFSTLSKNVDQLRANLQVSNQAYREGSSITNEYTQRNESAAGMIERLKNELQEAFVQPAIINGIRTMTAGAKEFLEIWSNPYVAPALNAITAFLASALLGVNKLSVAVKTLRNRIAEAGSATKGFAVVWKSFWSANWPSIIMGIGTAIVTMCVEWYNHAKEVRLEQEKLIGKINEERDAVNKLFDPLRKGNLQQEERRRLIAAINSQYGTYLSKMLTEASNAKEIARAYEAVNIQLQKKNILEGMEANNKKIREEHEGDLNKAGSWMRKIIGKSASKEMTPEVYEQLYGVLKEFQDVDLMQTKPGTNKLGADYDRFDKRLTEELRKLWKGGTFNKDVTESDFANIKRAALDYWREMYGVSKEQAKVNQSLQDELNYVIRKARTAANTDIPELLKQLDTSRKPHEGNTKDYSAEEARAVVDAYDAIRNYYDTHRDELDENQLKQLQKALNINIEGYRKQSVGTAPTITDGSGTAFDRQSSDHLKKRKKELQKMADLLEDGFDVTLLHYDKEFQKTGIETVDEAREWFNSQMQQIQTVLDARRKASNPTKLTKVSVASNQPVSDAAVAELDRYYEDRKAQIEIERSKELITEGEFNRRMEQTEQEHLLRRSQLRQSFTKTMTEKETQQFREWWDSVEKLGTVEWSKIEKEWSKHATPDDIAKNNLAAARDMTAMHDIVVKQVKAIQDIIDKERPFNGITKDLQTNLTTMGILTAHMSKERDELMAKNADMTKFNEKQAQEAFKEMTFLLGEAENAYSTTAEEVMQRAAEAGLTAWVEEMKQNPQMQEGLMAQLRSTFDTIQDAIKKEASQLKKEAEIMWNNILMPDGETTMKQAFDKTISTLGIEQGRVSRANSLIGAGQASERVVDKLAIKQMQVQMSMQKAYYDLMRKRGLAQVEILKQQSKELEEQGKLEEAKRKSQDAQHVQMALNLATTKEQTELLKLEEELTAKIEESQNRLYTELKEWGNLLASSLQSIFEASNAGNADYYNERAKMDLTGKGGPGAGTYVVIDNAGTSDAQAHYEYLDERQALEREHEIEQQNAQAEAWSKVMDDINMKMSESITDWMNAFLQSQSVDLNTAALGANTAAINALTSAMGGVPAAEGSGDMGVGEYGVPNSIRRPEENNGGEAPTYKAPWQMTEEDIVKGQENMGLMWQSYTEQGTEAMMQMQENLAETPGITPPWQMTEESMQAGMENMQNAYQGMVDASNKATGQVLANQSKIQQGENQTDKKISSGAQSAFAKMTAAANLYGIAYQAMSNDNLSTAQKFEMIAVQAAGQAAISALTASLAQNTGQVAADTPAVASKAFAQLGPIGGAAAFAAITAILGGLVGLAVSKIAKSKSQIAQVTGASVGAGRMATGMLTYGEGNVNEFTDPSTLTPGRQYNVDSADGKTYRARYMGKNAKTHITNGPEFHLVGEKGREAIIDAHTTRQLQMDDNGIWQSIQTLYNGGRLSHSSMRRRGRGVRAFADGNLDEFEEIESTLGGGDSGMSMEQVISLKESIDRQSDLLEDLRTNGIKATFDVYGKGGLVDSYDTGKKNVTRHGERY